MTDGTSPLAGVHIGVTDSIGGGGSNTDASGDYAFDLPAGTYSLTASKYGYTPSIQGASSSPWAATRRRTSCCPRRRWRPSAAR